MGRGEADGALNGGREARVGFEVEVEVGGGGGGPRAPAPPPSPDGIARPEKAAHGSACCRADQGGRTELAAERAAPGKTFPEPRHGQSHGHGRDTGPSLPLNLRIQARIASLVIQVALGRGRGRGRGAEPRTTAAWAGEVGEYKTEVRWTRHGCTRQCCVVANVLGTVGMHALCMNGCTDYC